MIAREALKKPIDSSWNALSGVWPQIWPQVNSLGSRGQKSQKVHFLGNSFLPALAYLIMIESWFKHHRVSLVKAVRMMYNMTSKGQFENLTSGQGHRRSWNVRNRSCCISIDAHGRDKHISACFTPLSSFWRPQLIKNHKRPVVTSDDLAEVTDEKLYLGHHKWPLKVWFWKNWTDPMRFGEDRSNSIFSHWLVMVSARNWPDLRSPI